MYILITAISRHIWTAIHTNFFDDLDSKGLQSSSYHNLTVALQKVWNNSTNPTTEKSELKMPHTGLDTATMKNSGLGQNTTGTTTNITTTISGSTSNGNSSGGGDAGEVHRVASERVILLGRSIVNNDISFTSTAVRSAYSENGNSLVNITTMPVISRTTSDNTTSITLTDTEDSNNNSNYSSIMSSISDGQNYDLNSFMMMSSEDPSTQMSSQGDLSLSPTTIDLNRYIEPDVTYEISDRKKRVSGVFVSARDCHWTVVTSNVLLTKSGLYERMKVCSIRVYTVYVCVYGLYHTTHVHIRLCYYITICIVHMCMGA